jgi:hypothetical protein
VTWTDWAISIGLIILVLRQIRGKPVTLTGLFWPVGLVVWAGFEYLGDFPGYASDWIFAACLSTVGLLLGLGCGVLTQVYPSEGKVMAKATIPAAALWIFGMSGRLAFGVAALNGWTEPIIWVSEKLDLHSEGTWPTALITMSLCEVSSRTAVLLAKYRMVSRELDATKSGDLLPAPTNTA